MEFDFRTASFSPATDTICLQYRTIGLRYDELLFTCAGALRIRKEETAERKERLYWIAHMQPLPVKFEILTVI